ncbi:hypothetical protein [Burkholderia sp. BCC1988]|uniref:hypothetical protein n=1 Tax=Burkholderia sp. BCC1988 TaxID=2817443 RepID=UPI002AB1BE50|nr:hypothetical protein [Burkholderia sp. BCC1988]
MLTAFRQRLGILSGPVGKLAARRTRRIDARQTLTPSAFRLRFRPAHSHAPPQRTIEMPRPRLDFRSPEYDHSITQRANDRIRQERLARTGDTG